MNKHAVQEIARLININMRHAINNITTDSAQVLTTGRNDASAHANGNQVRLKEVQP